MDAKKIGRLTEISLGSAQSTANEPAFNSLFSIVVMDSLCKHFVDQPVEFLSHAC